MEREEEGRVRQRIAQDVGEDCLPEAEVPPSGDFVRCRTSRSEARFSWTYRQGLGDGRSEVMPSAARQARSGKLTPAWADPRRLRQKRGFHSRILNFPSLLSQRASMFATPLQPMRRAIRETSPRRASTGW